MIDRRSLVAGLSLSWLAAGCGVPQPVETEVAEGDPEASSVRLLLRVDVEAARAAGELEPGADDADVVRQVVEILQQRMDLLGRDVRVEPTAEGPTLISAALHGEVKPVHLARVTTELERRGRMGIYLQVRSGDGIDLEREREFLRAWLESNANTSLDAFHALASDADGPDARVRWAEHSERDDRFAQGTRLECCVPLLVQRDPAWRFGTGDLLEVSPDQDASGYPAIRFELTYDRKDDFGAFTEAHVDRLMVIEIDGTCVTVATISERLPGQGVIMGRDAAAEVEARIALLRAGELPAPVQVVEVR